MIGFNKIVILMFTGALVVACGGNTRQSTLGDLRYEPKQEEEIEFAKLSHKEVREEYKELLDLFEDEQLKEQIERRIADVYMMESVHQQSESDVHNRYYVEAIKEYQKILEKYPNSPDNAEVLYQLSKAYDMDGQQDKALDMLTRLTTKHPWYKYNAEAWFRKADIHFSNQNYAAAESAYLKVTQLPNEKLWVNAHYMLGWSYYKRYQYEKGLDSFAYVLAQYLGEAENTDGLDKTVKPLVEDALHSISLALSNVGSAKTIQDVKGLSGKNYVWMIYRNLGDYHLEKDLYGEAVASYKEFIKNYSASKRAPAFHNMVINAHIKGGFPVQALEEKALYVTAYGFHSSYSIDDPVIRQEVSTSLRAYLEELAKFSHSQAQIFQKDVLAMQEKPKGLESKIQKTKASIIESYNTAAKYYGELAQTFPDDEKFDETIFFKAETLFSAGRLEEAIDDYQHVAYNPKGKSAEAHRPDSGYAAIISYQKIIDGLESNARKKRQWQELAVESMLRFTATFHKDERAPSVLTNTAEYLFSLDNYEQAIEVSSSLIDENVDLDVKLKKTAYGILAHSWFKLENYPKAEDSYIRQRQLVDKDSEEFTQITERLATTIHKNSEVIIHTGDKEGTVAELLKIKSLAPLSTRRVPAQYDAAILLLELEQWDAAIVELTDLKENYSDHELAVDFPRKLALAYEKDERWLAAAEAYLKLSETDPDQEIKREAMFATAYMYEKANSLDLAITWFKRYAHIYEEPFDSRMEARFHLASNYEKLNDNDKQQYWLRRIIEGNRSAGAAGTERSRWLAAWANIKYGDFYAAKFTASKLRQPIAKSMTKRNEFLEQASSRYQEAAESEILEYVTMSGFKIAMLYQTLAKDLRLAAPPKGLSSSDVELYRSIIEENSQPLDQLAIELYEANANRAWEGEFNEWIDSSFRQLAILNPDRYAKTELLVSYGDDIR